MRDIRGYWGIGLHDIGGHMRTSVPRAALLIALSLAFAASTVTIASAKGPGAGGGTPHGFSQGNKTGWKGGNVPPGWSKGKKVGWGTATPRTSPPGWR